MQVQVKSCARLTVSMTMLLPGLLFLSDGADAQTVIQRRVNLTARNTLGPNEEGKCTVEVLVDGVAEVSINGDTGSLKTISGRPAEWRRFQCNGVLPPNAGEFQFKAVDGRGQQTLAGDSRSSSSVVVHIEDEDGGNDGYTFDLTWRGTTSMFGGSGTNGTARGSTSTNGPFGAGAISSSPFDKDGPAVVLTNSNSLPLPRTNNGRYTNEDAIHKCEDLIADEAANRSSSQTFVMRDSKLESRSTRNQERVAVTVDVRRGRDWERFDFACVVDFSMGRIGHPTNGPGRRR